MGPFGVFLVFKGQDLGGNQAKAYKHPNHAKLLQHNYCALKVEYSHAKLLRVCTWLVASGDEGSVRNQLKRRTKAPNAYSTPPAPTPRARKGFPHVKLQMWGLALRVKP